MKKIKTMFCSLAAAFGVFMFMTVNAHADGWWDEANQIWHEGYYTEGWWDDASQIWHEGQFVETGNGYNTAAQTVSASAATAPRQFTWYNQLGNPCVTIGSGDMVSNGCVPTSAAILASGYGNYTTPLDWGYYLYNTGNFDNTYGHGGTDLAWYDVASVLGINAWGIYDYNSFTSALASGATVACHIYSGFGGTHSVLATGFNNGITTVYDPVAGIRNQQTANLWNARSMEWNDTLSGTSFTALQ